MRMCSLARACVCATICVLASLSYQWRCLLPRSGVGLAAAMLVSAVPNVAVPDKVFHERAESCGWTGGGVAGFVVLRYCMHVMASLVRVATRVCIFMRFVQSLLHCRQQG